MCNDTTLPSFSKDRSCPKCGYPAIGAKDWTPGITKQQAERARRLTGGIVVPGPERVTRFCQGCNYSWFEQPMDAKQS